ncbi:MAG: hypothetical protein FWD01_01750 [Defluviitaleaceae bacterium]|nr:hypothetical protein [Defluviitaleaceae bacterium]
MKVVDSLTGKTLESKNIMVIENWKQNPKRFGTVNLQEPKTDSPKSELSKSEAEPETKSERVKRNARPIS